jgi:16S rRNA (cytosine967-C5)-methyltransferase
VGAVSPAREVSFRILTKVQAGAYASDLLRREAADLDPRDAALAHAIVFGCLRRQSELDWLIIHYSGRARLKLDDAVRIALRMGLYQIRFLERIPPHAAVTESVELVKRARKRSAAGFVNAVLRKAVAERDRGVEAPAPDLATELSLPGWMLERWTRRYGREIAEGIARAALQEPELCVNPTTGRQQDIGAQSIVPLLEIEPGMSVLDVCAAPGNKTAQAIAAGGKVVACDRYLSRLLEVPAAASRAAVDAVMSLPFSAKFDRILVDAPCSGTGTLARNPEIKWRLRARDFDAFASRQRAILKNALERLAPGGRLVYATCSLEPEENEDVVDKIEVGEVVGTHLRIPGRDPGDGFFAAVIILN